MPRPKQSTVRVQRDSYEGKGGTHAPRWRVYVHHRSPTGELTRKSFLAPRGSSEATAKAAGDRMLGEMQAADRQASELVRRARVETRDEPTQPLHPTTHQTTTVAAFAVRYMAEFCEANRQAPATLARKRAALALHILPAIGSVPLARVTGEHVQQIKARLSGLQARSVNSMLQVLRSMLRVAVEWQIIPQAPRVRMVAVPDDEPDWFEVDEYERLCKAASTGDLRTLAMVLLGGDAGLRRGEIMALKWADVDFAGNRIVVRASRSRQGEKPPKNGRTRRVPMTPNLRHTLADLRRVRGDGAYVLVSMERRTYGRGRTPLYPGLPGEGTLRYWFHAACDAADLEPKGLHSLRHAFCSHLAARRVDARTIMELAGHANLQTTQRYLHVATDAPVAGIQALDRAPLFGDSSTNRAKTPETPSYLQ
jgi:integrase